MLKDTKKTEEHITKWLRDYAINVKQNGYVIGVSGGIDSAVISTLCAKTGLRTIVMDIPIHQKIDEVSRAKDHINWLCDNFENVEHITFDLTSVFDQFSKIFGDISHSSTCLDDFDLTMANTRSRLRMSALYSISNINKMLVCGSGNKVEDYGIGFCTKGGDSMVDLSPIGDLMKSEVYQLGATLGVNQAILNARPTDGLWDNGATDEDQIGATYDELEWVMNTFTEEELKYTDMFDLTSRQKEVVKIYKTRHYANAHKMSMPPICKL